MAFSLQIRAHSEIGLVRNNNQDSAYVSPHLIVVADGMGGAAAGDLASSVAIRELQRVDEQNLAADASGGEPLASGQMLEALSGALAKANDALSDLVEWDRSFEGMGTTVCGAMFDGEHYGICHIGDSRGYLLRDGELTRLTHDHSWVQSLIDEGKITPEEAAKHPHRSLLLKVLNGQPVHTPDFTLVDAKLGDRLLFCSDGLCGMVDNDEIIRKLLSADKPLESIVRSLTQAAHQGGGLDNITLIVADVVEHDDALQAVPPQVLGAAETLKIPEIDFSEPIQLSEFIENTTRLPRERVPASDGKAISDEALPDGVIDPDRFEAIRYTPHIASRRRRWIGWVVTILVILAVLVAGVFGGRAYIESQHFIGPDDEHVAIYQGIPEQILGHPLSTLTQSSEIVVADLPPYYASKVRNKELRYASEHAAQTQVEMLGEMAERCKAERAASVPAESSTPQTPGADSPATDSPAETQSPTDSGSAPVTPDGTASAVGSGTPGSSASTSRPDLEACG
ncbi:protein phosphatase 2C domain-containing protein [Brooklawnia sp.]|uniref:PP2C family protein-serine/threonine phosphatase n=1 Tax=Brooklawnia sp. TaxID=2699740 RepID=UPI00311F3AFB